MVSQPHQEKDVQRRTSAPTVTTVFKLIADKIKQCPRGGHKPVWRSCEKSTNRYMTDARKYRNMSYLVMLRKVGSDPGSTSGVGTTADI